MMPSPTWVWSNIADVILVLHDTEVEWCRPGLVAKSLWREGDDVDWRVNTESLSEETYSQTQENLVFPGCRSWLLVQVPDPIPFG